MSSHNSNMIKAVMKLQALFRGRRSREAVGRPQLARLKAAAGLGMPAMARLARLAKVRAADFIAEVENEARRGSFSAATLIHEAEDAETQGNSRVESEIQEQKRILEKDSAEQKRQQEEEERLQRQRQKQAKKKKPLTEEEREQLDDFAFTPEEQALLAKQSKEGSHDSTNSSDPDKPSLFREYQDFPVYPKLMLRADPPEKEMPTKTGELVVVQTCWVEVPSRPMRNLRVRQEDLEAATLPVPGAGDNSKRIQDGGSEDEMSEFSDDPSSPSDLGSEDALDNLFVDSGEDDGFEDDPEDENAELLALA